MSLIKKLVHNDHWETSIYTKRCIWTEEGYAPFTQSSHFANYLFKAANLPVQKTAKFLVLLDVWILDKTCTLCHIAFYWNFLPGTIMCTDIFCKKHLCIVLYCHYSLPSCGHHFGLLLHCAVSIRLPDSILHTQSCVKWRYYFATLCTVTSHEVMNMQCCACFLNCFYLIR